MREYDDHRRMATMSAPPFSLHFILVTSSAPCPPPSWPCCQDGGGQGAEEVVVWMATSTEACPWYQDEVEGRDVGTVKHKNEVVGGSSVEKA